MPSRGRARGRPAKRRGVSLDMNNPMKWSSSKLRESLSHHGIVTSPTFPLGILRKLYEENISSIRTPKNANLAARTCGTVSVHTHAALPSPAANSRNIRGNAARSRRDAEQLMTGNVLAEERLFFPVSETAVHFTETASPLHNRSELSAAGTVTVTPTPATPHADGRAESRSPTSAASLMPPADVTTHSHRAESRSQGTPNTEVGCACAAGSTSAQVNSGHVNNVTSNPILSMITQTFTALQTAMTSAMKPKKENDVKDAYGLEAYYKYLPASNTNAVPFIQNSHVLMQPRPLQYTAAASSGDVTRHGPPPYLAQPHGIAPDQAPRMELVTPSLRQKILQGKDVNLAALLIPSYDVDRDQGMKLASSLTIVQFMRAFGRFKRIMCEAYPSRRDELDGYEALIHDIHHLHGDQFYEYHKIFSMRSATALQVHHMKLDWS